MPIRRISKSASAHVMSKTEGKRLFEHEVLTTTGLTPEEFIQKWETGQFPDSSKYVRLAMMIPLGRYQSA